MTDLNDKNMSDLKQQLERATSRELADDERLDAETGALRDAWVGLGQLLEANQTTIDEKEIVARAMSGEPEANQSKHSKRGRWMFVLVGGLAASIAIGVVLLMTPTPNVASPDNPGEVNETKSSVPDQPEMPNENNNQKVDQDSPVRPPQMAWDNDIDSEITYFQQRLGSLRDGYRSNDQTGNRRLNSLYERFDQLGREFEESSL